MRHVSEKLLTPLLHILDECEAEVKAKPHKDLDDHILLWNISRIKLALSVKHVKK